MEPIKKSIVDTTLTRRDFLRAGIGGISAALLMNDAGAQTNAGLSAKQIATLATVQKNKLHGGLVSDIKDPVLVGENIVFTNDWLKYIGTGKTLTRAQFESWRNRLEIVYKSYSELVGSLRVNPHPQIIINLKPASEFSRNTTSANTASASGLISFNEGYHGFKTILGDIAKHNSTDMTMMHEIAHVFEGGHTWSAERERIVDLLIAYAMESNKELRYGGPNPGDLSWGSTSGTWHRVGRYNRARDIYAAGIDKPPFSGDVSSQSNRDAYDLYLLGLVDVVGWDVYKKAFSSYTDRNFKPNIFEEIKSAPASATIEEKREPVRLRKAQRARDFFDRIEYFSGTPNVFAKLSINDKNGRRLDTGALFEKYFSHEKTKLIQKNLDPLQYAQRNISMQPTPRSNANEGISR